MDKRREAQLWRQKVLGWQRAEELEKKRRPTEELDREISALFKAARALPIHPVEEAELERVRETWVRLKRAKRKS